MHNNRAKVQEVFVTFSGHLLSCLFLLQKNLSKETVAAGRVRLKKTAETKVEKFILRRYGRSPKKSIFYHGTVFFIYQRHVDGGGVDIQQKVRTLPF